MTQQIRDEIARLTTDLAGDDAYMRELDAVGRHPIPDTLDAAVNVIEGAGWTISGVRFFRVYVYIEAQNADGLMIDSEANKYLNHESARAAYRVAHWQLALACVKQSRPTRQEGKQ